MVGLISENEDPWWVDQHLIALMALTKHFDRDAVWPRRPAGVQHFMESFRTLMREHPWKERYPSP